MKKDHLFKYQKPFYRRFFYFYFASHLTLPTQTQFIVENEYLVFLDLYSSNLS